MWPTIIVTTVIAIVFLAIVISGIKNKLNGKSSCGCSCGGCALKDTCHSHSKED